MQLVGKIGNIRKKTKDLNDQLGKLNGNSEREYKTDTDITEKFSNESENT